MSAKDILATMTDDDTNDSDVPKARSTCVIESEAREVTADIIKEEELAALANKDEESAKEHFEAQLLAFENALDDFLFKREFSLAELKPNLGELPDHFVRGISVGLELSLMKLRSPSRALALGLIHKAVQDILSV
ncbi:hypothetical protein FGB62_109g00 [Gracilaria domingensis]|nr:hypothetical protein FGB62_109g00 [Gracilaria domingensis]